MPRYFFNVSNGHGFTRDEEGIDLQDQAAAQRMAMDSIRSIVAEEARKGSLDLDGYIDVLDSSATRLARIPFPDAFALRLPNPADAP